MPDNTMAITYISNNKLFLLNEDGTTRQLPCGRIEAYRNAVHSINSRQKWKNSGSGAQFMGAAASDEFVEDSYTSLNSTVFYSDRIAYVYSTPETAGICIRESDDSELETHVVASCELCFGESDCKDDLLAISCGNDPLERHIRIYTLPDNSYTDLTDGDTLEDYPSWSPSGRLLFSTKGYARDENNVIRASSPFSIAAVDGEGKTYTEIRSKDECDLLMPQEDMAGNLYFISSPIKAKQSGSLLLDVLLFPIRLIKAIIGFLNIFSIIFGGEALRGNGANPAKSKQKSQRDIIIEGNIINAERNRKQNEKNGDKLAGIMPHSRVLVCVSPNGEERIIKHGVLAYKLQSDGGIIISDGCHITRLFDGKQEKLIDAELAVSLSEHNIHTDK